MNTLDDLRATLDQHAEGLQDTAEHTRVAAVRRRVRVVRRRRASATAVAAVLVVAAGVAAVGSLRSPDRVEPAGPAVVGVDVPAEVSVLGFPYALSDSGPVEDPDEVVAVDELAVPRVVSLVGGDLGSGSATLFADGVAVSRVTGDEVGAPVPLSVDGAKLRVRYDDAPDGARSGLAFYEATGEPAPGVADGAIVFRDTVGSATLVDAGFSGETSEVALTYRGDLADLRLATDCATDEKGMWLTVEVDGQQASSAPCVWDGDRDPAGTWLDTVERWSDRQQHTVRAFLTRGSWDPAAIDTPARVGLALYEQGTTRVGSSDVPSLVEAYGRTWELDPAGMTTVEVDNWERTVDAADSDLLVAVTGDAETVRLDWSGEGTRGSAASMEDDLGNLSHGALLLRGDRYRARVTGQDVREVSVLVYRPA